MEPIILSAFLLAQIPVCPKRFVNAQIHNERVAPKAAPRNPCRYQQAGGTVFWKGRR